MIGPAVIAYLWTDSVKAMLTSSIIIGIICAVIGTEVAFTLDVSIAGAIATTIGLALLIAVICTPKTGYIATYRRQRHLRRHYRETMMLCHIYTHMNTPVAAIENGIGTIHEHLNWKPDYTHQAASHLKKQGLLYVTNGYYMLTDKGVAQVKKLFKYNTNTFSNKKKLKSMPICKISASSFIFNYMARTQHASDTT